MAPAKIRTARTGTQKATTRNVVPRLIASHSTKSVGLPARWKPVPSRATRSVHSA